MYSTFSNKTEIIIGNGNGDTFTGAKRVFIVTDKFMYEKEVTKYITKHLDTAEYQIFHDVKPNPDIATVSQGVKIILEFKPDMVVALGGGSPIDAAKGMIYFARMQDASIQLKFIAIPTTSGTGSEVTKFAVITDPDTETKYPLVEDSMLPDTAILDAELTKSVPPSITADTGLDVLTHAIEAFVCNMRNDFTDALAEKAIKLANKFLIQVFEKPDDVTLRQRVHNASCLAGMAFSNSGLGINHSMAHTLGAHFHIPHGKANALLLPYVISFNAGLYDELTEANKRYAKIARLIWLDSTNDRQSTINLVRALKRYIAKLNIPSSIKAAGVNREDFYKLLPAMVDSAYVDPCTAGNPRNCTKEDLTDLFIRAYEGTNGI
ncbi:alcohol dehydrogenase [Anaerocolumna cellulosilytica]|uniref:Alcohol dehydrogenase n=1 Tax=Anaerocolumna cellulosilytica TaxID=433286 RepID=A0A6S6R2E0_9FIRM|nr:1-propanol dehydrogenase PduQ [Anaerocolumna cellulosilytica]MBB5194790.1 alcohol dehydrogenase class IV [Anaerocolumna cellulosilytica]BCJ94247.1 alcohol dehydrogenase [Anaerocolumna cellulosilytica]